MTTTIDFRKAVPYNISNPVVTVELGESPNTSAVLVNGQALPGITALDLKSNLDLNCWDITLSLAGVKIIKK